MKCVNNLIKTAKTNYKKNNKTKQNNNKHTNSKWQNYYEK